jgi:hypothetical protein
MRAAVFLFAGAVGVSVVTAGLGACSDEPAVAPGDAGLDARVNDVDAALQPGSCSADTLCFDVKSVRSGTTPLSGRLVVVWIQLNDDGPDPAPQTAYEAPFNGTETRVAIPIAQIGLPTEPVLYCHRGCNDEAMCPCLREPKVGLAIVGVLPRSADGGSISARVGLAQMLVGYSDKAFKPAPAFEAGVYAPSDLLFPDGIEQGVFGYGFVQADGSTRNRLGIHPPGTVFTLEVCDTVDRLACSPKPLNLD